MNPQRLLTPVLMAILLLPLVAMGADRVVLFESFTNTSCPYCPDDNAVLADVVADYGTTEPIQMINVQYHVWWPSSSDPFYAGNIADNTNATNYYGVNAVPDLRSDGAAQPATTDYTSVVDYMNGRLAEPSPVTIDVTHSINENCEIVVEATVEADDALPASGLVVRMALVEESTHYDTAPGSNGQTDFYCTMRRMLPDFNGTPLTITTAGQSQVVTHSAPIEPGWRMIYAVVWVQDTSNDEVLQAGRSWPGEAAYWEEYLVEYQGLKVADMVDVGATASLTSEATNVGQFEDTFDIHMDTSGLPRDWTASLCMDGTCYPPFVTDLETTLATSEMEAITVDITPLGMGGEGTVTVSIRGRGNPCVSYGELTFKVITLGADVLLIDDDGARTYETFFEPAITASGRTITTWDLNWGKLGGSALSGFDAVVWFTGRETTSIDATDRANLAAFLDGGGRLFLTGQDIGYSIYDVQGSPDAIAWYNTYLGADYLTDSVSFREVEGMPGDVISDGWLFAIEGGDGADNQGYPSRIEPFGDGVRCLQYSQQAVAGTHLESGDFKTVYFAFGFEAISTQADRDMVMDGVLDWLTVDGSPVPEYGGGKAYLASAPLPTPNPFNPSTRIKFEMGGSLPGQVKIEVFDLRGCLVRSLYEGMVQPGPQSFEWDGRSNLGAEVASGTYMGVVQVGLDKKMVKMVLAK